MSNMRTETMSNLAETPSGRRVMTEASQDRPLRHRKSYEPPSSDIEPDCSKCTYAGCQGPPATPDLVVASGVDRIQSVPANGSMPLPIETCPFIRPVTIPIFASVRTAPGESISVHQDDKSAFHAAQAGAEDVE